ncbi:MAG: methyltransferase MtaB domain-containing protein [Clostridia bacterium]
MRKEFNEVAYNSAEEMVFGKALKPVTLKNGLMIGGGDVIPELNFTLPMMTISEETMPKVLAHYKEIAEGACKKAVELHAPAMGFEIEILPPCTFNPQWGIDVNKTVVDVVKEYEAKYGIKTCVRLTPVDIREGRDLEHMYHGKHWENVMETFRGAGETGADLLAIESIGGKHLHDDALMMCDLPKILFAYGVVGCKDMGILWDEIVKIAKETGSIASGDTACGFANTAMVLAERGLIPRSFAAVDRVMAAVRTIVAVEAGAIGPDKDCGYEGQYVKCITGTPISMEGKTSACAHSSSVGNIVSSMCDMWSNESVENVRLLGGMAPTVYAEQLIYDCRLMNTATKMGQAQVLKDLFVESDVALDPHAYILDPKVVFNISKKIVAAKGHFEKTRVAGLAAIEELKKAYAAGKVAMAERDAAYLDIMESQLLAITDEEAFIADQIKNNTTAAFVPAQYDM